MKNKKDIQEELKELSPFLSEIKGQPEGFQVPADYFSNLSDSVLEKVKPEPIAEQESRTNWFKVLMDSLQSYFQPRYALALATVALLIVAGIYFFNENTTEQYPSAMLLDEVPDEMLNEYVSENIDEFELALFEEHIDDNLESLSPTLNIEEDEELLEDLLDDLSVEDLEDLL